jgi:Leucine-rich repeat (LRR) protein
MLPAQRTLADSIRAGDSKVHGNSVRCVNKGITDITPFKGSQIMEQLFISSNRVRSLRRIDAFKNLRVLSISYNDISRISELKLLAGIPLKTLNMEGNPITKLPYYQHRVVALIPTLKLFDGRPVNEGLRGRAASTVAFDDQRLTELCVNELR